MNSDDEIENVPLYRSPMVLREQILLLLRRVIDPDLHKDIVSCNFIKGLTFDYDSGLVQFTLDLTTPACPMKESFVEQCKSHLHQLEWIKTVQINVTASSSSTNQFPGDASKNLKNVKFILAVSSCKGGVGKSSIAVNMAFMLSRLGAKVGLVDCDVYGPSLHTLVPIEAPQVYFRPGETDDVQESLAKGQGDLIPCEYNGVKLMSYSYFRPEATAFAAVRGPLASGLVYQMVTQTAWGDLDYLLLDLPPGTGDIHLTICQSIKISGAVVVTTPQRLSLIDVEKGIHFFQKLQVPTVAIVENMAYTVCAHCGTKSETFPSLLTIDIAPQDTPSTTDKGHDCHGISVSLGVPKPELTAPLQRLVDQFGVGVHFSLPMDPRLSAVQFSVKDSSEIVFPFACAFDEDNDLWRDYRHMVQEICRELSKVVFGGSANTPDVSVTDDNLIQVVMNLAGGGSDVSLVEPREVRLSCKCAECVDEITGKPKLNPRRIPLDISVKKFDQVNNYAVNIEWSDGHSSIIAFKALETLTQKVSSTGRRCLDDEDILDW